ncbi:DNA adenine methylase, partial [Pseudoalteromonas agarivorans]
FENNTPVLISNHHTEWTRKIYSQASLDQIQLKRTISPKGGSRNKDDQLIAMYLPPKQPLRKMP